MGSTATLHPADPILQAYGLGKLDDASSASVSQHLESCDSCRQRVAELSSDDFLGRLRQANVMPDKAASQWSPSAESFADGGSSPFIPPPPADTLPPELVDHPDWEIIRELGRGGMGVVYLANNRLMGRSEVLKVVGRHLIERPGVADRFLREIRSAAMLHHANIVAAYTAMRIGNSLVLAMEYVDGLDLAAKVKDQGSLPVAHACYFIHQAALGLQHAHERGMVHRDIKPANLILARDGKKAIVKVLDFGLAKVTSEGQTDSNLTREGQMLGTPDFIAPEQIRDAQSADIRADIYSLGCTLYYLLAGRAPFRGDSIWDLYQAHFSMDAHPLNLVRPEVPAELAAIVSKMMAKEPRRRFQTPGDVAQVLVPFFKSPTRQSSVSSLIATDAVPHGAAPNSSSDASSAPAQAGLQVTQSNQPEPIPSPRRSDRVSRESLIEIKVDGSLVSAVITKPAEQTLRLTERPARYPRSMWLSMAAGIFVLGLAAAWLGRHFKNEKPDGKLGGDYKQMDRGIADAGNSKLIPPRTREPSGIEGPVNEAAGNSVQVTLHLDDPHGEVPDQKKPESMLKIRAKNPPGSEKARDIDRPKPNATDFPPGDDRRAAQFVLARGGTVKVQTARGTMELKRGDALPADPFALVLVAVNEMANLTDADLASLAGLAGLVELRLGGSKLITDAGLHHMRGLKRLEILALGGTTVADAGLANLELLTNLTLLDLRGTKITDAGLAYLRNLRRLEELKLGSTGLTSAGLANIGKLKALKRLYFWEEHLTDESLGQLKVLTQLEALDLGGTGVSDAGLAHLKVLANLRVLNLYHTNVTAVGFQEAGELAQLRELSLRSTRVSDDKLAFLQRLPQLESLDLAHTGVTDGGLVLLHNLSRLKRVDLTSTMVTRSGVQDFQRALPGCQLIANPREVPPAPTGKLGEIVRIPAKPCHNPIAFSFDSERVAIDDSWRIKIVELKSGKTIWEIPAERPVVGNLNCVLSMVFRKDGCIVASYEDQMVRMWDATGRRKVLDFDNKPQGGQFRDLKYPAAGNHILGHSQKEIRLWDAETGKGITSYTPPSPVKSLDLGVKGRVVSLHEDNNYQLWDVLPIRNADPNLVGFWDETKKAASVCFSPNGFLLLARLQGDPRFFVLRFENGDVQTFLHGLETNLIDAAFIPGLHQVATLHADNTFRRWDLNTGGILYERKFATEARSLGIAPNGQYIVLLFKGEALLYTTSQLNR